MERRAIFLLLVFLSTAFVFGKDVLNEDFEEKISQKRHFKSPEFREEDLKRTLPRKPFFSSLKHQLNFMPLSVSSPFDIKQDIVLVLDKSGSIGYSDFVLEKRFIESLIEYFPKFPSTTRVAALTYSTYVNLEFDFNEYVNKECLQKGVEAIRYTGGWTATGKALRYVLNNLMFNTAAGARAGAKKVLIVITDGKSNWGVNPGTPAAQLRRRGVVSFVIGVTSNTVQKELEAIAGTRSNVFHVSSYSALSKVTKEIYGDRDLHKSCTNGQTLYDACGRRCKCQNGKLVKCCRLRKEFTDMSYAERVRYINTVKTASTNPAYKPRYDKLLTLHKTIFFGHKIHQKDFFLPWHRWYILQYENLLRQIDCRVTVPYWDWSLVAGDPWSSSIWNTGDDGFGGNGVPRQQGCVNTGSFKASGWSLPASAGGRCLRRNFNGIVPDAITVKNAITMLSNFHEFEPLLRLDFHNGVHCSIGGTMCTSNAATAPEFFLHHGFVDKIWWDWQKKSHTRKFHPYFQSQAETMSSTSYRSRDFLDLNNQPSCVCVEYLDPKNSVYKKIQGMSSIALSQTPRQRLPPLSSEARRLFHVTQAEMRLLSNIRAKIEPKHFVVKSSLRGKDAILGFKSDALK